MTDIMNTSVSQKLSNECCKNHFPLSTNVVAENINEANATNVAQNYGRGKIISAIF